VLPPPSPVVSYHWRISPLSGYSIAPANVTSHQLVTTPRSLNHFNSLTVCKTSVTGGAGIGRCNQCLVGLAIGAIEQIREEATRLAHGDPGVAASGRVVERAATHDERSPAVLLKLVNTSIGDGVIRRSKAAPTLSVQPSEVCYRYGIAAIVSQSEERLTKRRTTQRYSLVTGIYCGHVEVLGILPVYI
jgi:hypothetical protein